jgi:hypothetical protein
MKFKQFILIFFIVISTSNLFSQVKSYPGAFTRMGFDAKGMAMGNSIGALAKDNLSSYYNPAGIVFQERTTVNLSYTFLNLDRSLNCFNFIHKVRIRQLDTSQNLLAAFSGGLINSGVSDIEQRDGDGFLSQTLSTFENQFFFSIAFMPFNKLSVGASFKFLYSKLYTDVTSSGFGLDLGFLYVVSDALSVSGVIKDLNSEYQWDTSKLYGQSGNTTKDRFPLLKKLGAAYKAFKNGIITMEFETSNQSTDILRFGGEYQFLEYLCLRAGIDRFDLSNTDNGIKPTFGFGLSKGLGSFTPTLNYVFAYEPFSHYPIQMLTLTMQF